MSGEYSKTHSGQSCLDYEMRLGTSAGDQPGSCRLEKHFGDQNTKKAACKFWAPAATEALLASHVSDALGHPHHT